MEIEFVDSVEAIEPEWEELAARVGASPFAQPGWISLWWSVFGRGELKIVAGRRKGRLSCVFPLYQRLGIVRSTGNDHTPVYSVLAEGPEAAAELSAALFSRLKRHVLLYSLDATDESTIELHRAALAAGAIVSLDPLSKSPYLEMEGDWESFQERRSPKLLGDLRRRRRLLDGQGNVSIESHLGSVTPELLREGFLIEPSGWKLEAGTAIVSHPETERFYNGLAKWAGERGSLRLDFLRLDGKPLAFRLGLEERGVHYSLKTGYDPGAKRVAPGKLLLWASIERAFAEGLRRYEFFGTGEAWKLEWANRERQFVKLEIFSNSAAGRLERTLIGTYRRYVKPLLRR